MFNNVGLRKIPENQDGPYIFVFKLSPHKGSMAKANENSDKNPYHESSKVMKIDENVINLKTKYIFECTLEV